MKDIKHIAAALKELGHPIRLQIFQSLVQSGHKGMTVGSIQKIVAIPNSTLSHHIAKLITVNLISQRRASTSLYCIPQFDNLNLIIDFLQKECCSKEVCD